MPELLQPDADVVFTGVARSIAGVLGATVAGVGVWNEARQRFAFWTTHGKRERTLAETIGANAFLEQRPTAVDERTSEKKVPDGWRIHDTHVVLSAPISIGRSRLGVVSLISDRAAIFTDDDLALLQLLANHAAVVVENRRLYDRVQSLNTDLSGRGARSCGN